MVLLPKEHGAYGQVTLPLVTALGAAGVSTAGLLLTAGAVAAFVAHEPAAILLGLRGARTSHEHGAAAMLCLAFCVGITTIAGVLSLFTIEREVRWSIAVPFAPAVLLGIATIRGREKSWYGELSAALAFAGLAVPVSMAAGASLNAAAAVAVPFALLFITSTLAVRTVILRVRGGGNARAAAATRRSAFAVTAVGAACLVWLRAVEVLTASTLVASTPGLLTALVITARPPQPTRLRTIGWTLVAVSVLTAVIVVADCLELPCDAGLASSVRAASEGGESLSAQEPHQKSRYRMGSSARSRTASTMPRRLKIEVVIDFMALRRRV